MKAMLLAAGRGERMRPLTDLKPKPLLEAGGKPLIVWLIEKLVYAGINELVINTAYLGSQIVAELGDGKCFGSSIQYSHEGHALDTAGGISYALPMLGDKPFAVVTSDIFCDYDFSRLPELAKALEVSRDMAHLVLVDNPPHHPDGDFILRDGRLTNVNDAIPTLVHLSSTLTYSGIGIYRPSLFHHIPCGSIEPLARLLRQQIACGKVSGEHHPGLWMDIGTPQRLSELDRLVR